MTESGLSGIVKESSEDIVDSTHKKHRSAWRTTVPALIISLTAGVFGSYLIGKYFREREFVVKDPATSKNYILSVSPSWQMPGAITAEPLNMEDGEKIFRDIGKKGHITDVDNPYSDDSLPRYTQPTTEDSFVYARIYGQFQTHNYRELKEGPVFWK